jgi:AraC-like DNA-binding protein
MAKTRPTTATSSRQPPPALRCATSASVCFGRAQISRHLDPNCKNAHNPALRQRPARRFNAAPPLHFFLSRPASRPMVKCFSTFTISMKPALSIDDFLRAPVGRYVADRTWLFFCANETLSGFVLWEKPDLEDARALLRVMPFRGSPLAFCRRRLVDVRRLDAPHPDAFAAFVEHLCDHGESLHRAVERLAIVRGSRLSQAITAGLPHVAPMDFPVAFFDDPTKALRWLGFADNGLTSELDQLQDAVSGTPKLLRDLRARLRTHLRSPSLRAISASLGLSQRTLQRRLNERGTSFQSEINAVRVEAARELMVETTLSISEIATKIGCGSPQHFSALFRKLTGTAPTEWRKGARHRLAR